MVQNKDSSNGRLNYHWPHHVAIAESLRVTVWQIRFFQASAPQRAM